MADHFFPGNARSQISVILLRPLIVKNGLSEFMVEILKKNGFLVLERKVQTLNRQQATILCNMETVSESHLELYLDMVMSGPSEILVVSKLGAISDAKSIVHGSTTGRRRQNQVDDENESIKIDSIGAMF